MSIGVSPFAADHATEIHDDETVTIPLETLADIAEDARVAAVDVDDDPANGVWAVRNLRDRLAGLVGQ